VSARRAVVAALFGVTLLAACGNQVDISARAQRQLQAGLDDVRTAVLAADRPGAQSALRDLERSVSQLVAGDQLSDGRAAEILAAAQDVAAQLTLLAAPEPTISPTPEPTETTTPAPPEKPDKPEEHGKDENHGKGKGHH
jgi:cell division septation protein DedD